MSSSEICYDTKDSTEIKRILSIDGGGIKGAFAAAFLSQMEENLGSPIHEYFDLIVGTSTGGIIALGLGLGVPTKDILQFYSEHGRKIFPHRRKITTCINFFLRFGGRALYKSDELQRILNETFGEKNLGDSLNRLVIPAWHAQSSDVYIYKTSHHDRLKNDFRERAVDIAMATSAAPIYFDQYKNANGDIFLDGGIYANNPINIAVNEAIGILEWPASDLRILSLGSPEAKPKLQKKDITICNLLDLVDLSFWAQSSFLQASAKILTGHPHSGEKIFRYAPKVNQGEYALDDVSRLDDLISLGRKEARDAEPKLEKIFFGSPAGKFNPIHTS